jgi:hypothetical protein
MTMLLLLLFFKNEDKSEKKSEEGGKERVEKGVCDPYRRSLEHFGFLTSFACVAQNAE